MSYDTEKGILAAALQDCAPEWIESEMPDGSVLVTRAVQAEVSKLLDYLHAAGWRLVKEESR